MTISSATKFIHYPTSVTVPAIPNSSRSSHFPFLPENLKHKVVCLRSRIYSPSLSSTASGGSLSVKCNDAKSSESEPGVGDGNENEALKTVLKLYSAIKNKNISELSEVMGDESECVSNFFPLLRMLRVKSQMSEFCSHLIKNLRDNIVFIVHPTIEDGTTVGVKWKIAWSNTHVPLGKGFSIHSGHSFGGRLLIGNVEMILKPLLQLKPLRLKTIAAIANLLDQINLTWMPKQERTKAASLGLGFFFLVLSLFLFQFSLR